MSWWPGEGGGGGGGGDWGAKIRNCLCEISYKICKVQLVNKFKDSSNSGISIAIQLSNIFGNESIVTIFRSAEF